MSVFCSLSGITDYIFLASSEVFVCEQKNENNFTPSENDFTPEEINKREQMSKDICSLGEYRLYAVGN